MKMNFKSFPVYTGISREKTLPMNISLVISDGIYGNVPGIQAHSLALKIYQSEGEVELDDSELRILNSSLDLFVGVLSDSVRDYIRNKKE